VKQIEDANRVQGDQGMGIAPEDDHQAIARTPITMIPFEYASLRPRMAELVREVVLA